jgi:MFS family permease
VATLETLRNVFSFMRGNVLVMTVCECVWRMTIDVLWPFLSMYVLSLGGSYETIGLVMAAGNLASLILYPLGGYIADYQGRIKLIGYMTFAYGAAFLIPAFTNSWQWLGVGMFAQSLVTFYFPARTALIADSLPPEKRGIGFAATTAIPSAFGIGAPFIGGWLIENFGMGGTIHGLYLSGFFIASAIAFFRLRYLRETVDNPNRLELSLRSVPSLIVKAYRSVYGVLWEVPRRLYVLSLLVSTTVFFASLASSFWIVRDHRPELPAVGDRHARQWAGERGPGHTRREPCGQIQQEAYHGAVPAPGFGPVLPVPTLPNVHPGGVARGLYHTHQRIHEPRLPEPVR